LTIYLADSFEGKNSSSLNNPTNDPKKLKMYGLDSCSDMKFKNSSTFYGVIYAPQTDVEFDNSADAYGAIVAKTFEQKNSADFYYDASLRDANEDDEAVRFEINRWEEN
jgi:hypothetical protein